MRSRLLDEWLICKILTSVSVWAVIRPEGLLRDQRWNLISSFQRPNSISPLPLNSRSATILINHGGYMSKVLKCREVGMDCDFVAHGENEEQVMSKAVEHARKDHGM